MSNDQQFSDELLNSFVDNELTTAEKSRVYLRINQDESLNRRVCELRKTRDLVQMAYKDLPAPPSIRPLAGTGWSVRRGVAAGLVLVLGVLVGWLQFGPTTRPIMDPPQAASTQGINPDIHSQTTLANVAAQPASQADPLTMPSVVAATKQEMKILFHLNSGNPDRIKEVLDESESLLKLYREQKQPARVEIVTNGQGLNLLLASGSPYPERIKRMQQQYANLTFVACQNTMERFTSLGIQTDLLPGVIIIDSAVAQIIRLQQEGWVYIQV